MGLMEQLEEDKKALEDLENAEEQTEEVAVEEEEAAEDDKVEEPDDKEAVTETAPEEEKGEETEVRHNDFYKTRRENAALKKKIAELETSGEAPQEEAPEGVPTPELQEVIQEVRMKKAEREFVKMEHDFKAQVDDYEDVSNQYKQSVYQALRIQNPRSSHDELLEQTKSQILIKAGQYLNSGFDPIEEMYSDAKALGFSKLPPAEEKEEAPKTPSVNTDRLAKNRTRNAGTAGATGMGSDAQMTKEVAASLSPMEWAKLSTEEKRSAMYGA